MDLIAAEPFQLVRIQRLAKGLLADQGPVREFVLAVLKPRQHLVFKKAAQALDIGADSSPSSILSGSRASTFAHHCCVSSRSAASAASQASLRSSSEQVERAAGHGLVCDIFLSVRRRGADRMRTRS